MEQEKIKGVRITTFNGIIIAVAFVLFAFLLFETVKIVNCHQDTVVTTQNYLRGQKDAEQVRDGSDLLTESVYLFVETGELRYAEAYMKEVDVSRSRDLALEDLLQLGTDAKVEQEMAAAVQCSNDLMDREFYAMRLVCDAMGHPEESIPARVRDYPVSAEDAALPGPEKLEFARRMIFSDEYQEAKTEINGHLDYVLDAILASARRDQQNSEEALSRTLFVQRIFLSLLFTMNVAIFFFITVLIVRPLRIYIRNIREDSRIDVVGTYEFKYLALTYNDIYDMNNSQEKALQYAADHDPLTGAMNRNAFQKLCEFMEKSSAAIALLMIDVDKFKEVNDTYGHEVGDQALKAIAELLRNSFRSGDRVVRMGGDEFVVVMEGATPALQDIIREKISFMNGQLQKMPDLPPLSVSVGVAFSAAGYGDELYREADQALYRVKSAGRAGCEFAKKVMKK